MIHWKSVHLASGVAEMKAISFRDHDDKLLESVLMWGWGCVRVPITLRDWLCFQLMEAVGMTPLEDMGGGILGGTNCGSKWAGD